MTAHELEFTDGALLNDVALDVDDPSVAAYRVTLWEPLLMEGQLSGLLGGGRFQMITVLDSEAAWLMVDDQVVWTSTVPHGSDPLSAVLSLLAQWHTGGEGS